MLQAANLHFTSEGTTRMAVGNTAATVNTLSIIVNSANVMHMNPTRTVFNTPVSVGRDVIVTGNLYKAGDSWGHGQVLDDSHMAPALMFGGANTNVVYSAREAWAIIDPDMVYIVCRMVLTSKGTSTGLASVRFYNLPPMMSGGNGFSPVHFGWWSNMAANTVGLTGLTTANSSYAEISIKLGGPGTSELATQVHFTDTADFTYATSYAR